MPPPINWHREGWRRLASLPLLKAVGIPSFVALFFCGYFAAANHPLFPIHLVPAWGIDRAIGFHSGWIWIYCSLWVYASLPAALLDDRQSLLRCGGSAGILAAAGLAFFFLWPTRIPSGGVEFLKSADGGSNACPSLHVAFAIWACLRLDPILREIAPGKSSRLRFGSVLWCAAIAYSTMATKQHMAIDIIGGAFLAALAALLGHIARSARKNTEILAS